jgi:endo-1,4-beta-xylanase
VCSAISDAQDQYLRDTPAHRAIGDDYIVKAFESAHAADPDAQLYYNDYGNENAGKRDEPIRLVRELQATGVRLDAVGIQSHLRLDDLDAADRLDTAIAANGTEGVKIVISKLDVDVLPRRTQGADVAARERGGADPCARGLPNNVAEEQARFYRRIFLVVLRHRGVVTRVTLWGTRDGTSWLNCWPVFRRNNQPLLWDRALTPKPTLGAVLEVLATP